MGTAYDLQRASGQEQQGASTSVATPSPLQSNQDMVQDLGLGAQTGTSDEDWTTEAAAGSLGSEEWSFAVEDRNGFVSRGLDSPIHVGDTVHLSCDLGAGREVLHALGGSPSFVQGASIVRGNTVTVEFEAVAAGRHPFFLTAWKGAEGAPHHRFGAVLSVQMDPTLFCQRNLLATQLASLKYVALQASVGRMGAAWELAWEHHEKTLEAAEKAQELVPNLLLGAFVTGLGALAGTAAATAFKKVTDSVFLIDGAKDLAKFGVKSAVPKPDAGLPVVAMDPITFRAALEDRVGQEMVTVLELLSGWTQAATSGDPSFLLDFDPAEVVQQLLTLAGQPLEAVAPGLCADIGGGADEFERGMWAEWLEAYAYELQLDLYGPDLLIERWTARSQVNWPIVKRLEALLPEEAKAFMAQHAAVANERVKGEADELNGRRSR